MSSDKYNPEYTLLGIACGGVYAEAPNTRSDTPATVTIYDTRLACYYGDVIEGGVIIDKRPAFIKNWDAAVTPIFHGAMRKSTLPSGMKEDWNKNLVPISDYSEAGSLEYVALDVYLRYWEGMGARVGYRRGRTVIWNDGFVEEIYSEEYRWMDPAGKIRSESHLDPYNR